MFRRFSCDFWHLVASLLFFLRRPKGAVLRHVLRRLFYLHRTGESHRVETCRKRWRCNVRVETQMLQTSVVLPRFKQQQSKDIYIYISMFQMDLNRWTWTAPSLPDCQVILWNVSSHHLLCHRMILVIELMNPRPSRDHQLTHMWSRSLWPLRMSWLWTCHLLTRQVQASPAKPCSCNNSMQLAVLRWEFKSLDTSTWLEPATVGITYWRTQPLHKALTASSYGSPISLRQRFMANLSAESTSSLWAPATTTSSPSTWRCVLITGRAPHPGRTHNEGKAFWLNISEILHRKATGWPIIFCGDANAHVGECVTPAVGPLAPALENQAGTLFHEWLLAHQLFLPATFESTQHGDQHSTFSCPASDHSTRIDYVAAPIENNFISATSWVADNIDLSVHRTDHYAVLCRYAFQSYGRELGKASRQCAWDPQHLSSQLCSEDFLNALSSTFPPSPWHADPHDSAIQLATQTTAALHAVARPRKFWKSKSHISVSTWALGDEKKMLFKQLKTMQETLRFFKLVSKVGALFVQRPSTQHGCPWLMTFPTGFDYMITPVPALKRSIINWLPRFVKRFEMKMPSSTSRWRNSRLSPTPLRDSLVFGNTSEKFCPKTATRRTIFSTILVTACSRILRHWKLASLLTCIISRRCAFKTIVRLLVDQLSNNSPLQSFPP